MRILARLGTAGLLLTVAMTGHAAAQLSLSDVFAAPEKYNRKEVTLRVLCGSIRDRFGEYRMLYAPSAVAPTDFDSTLYFPYLWKVLDCNGDETGWTYSPDRAYEMEVTGTFTDYGKIRAVCGSADGKFRFHLDIRCVTSMKPLAVDIEPSGSPQPLCE